MFLDTNFLITAAQPGTPAARRMEEWLIAGEPLHISSIVWAEYLCGPVTAEERDATRALLTTIQPVDADTAALAAALFNATGRRSRSLPDCLIAATALLVGQPLATLNHADFHPFHPFGLILAS